MARIRRPPNGDAARKADEEFYRRHPDRKSKPLTNTRIDDKLRGEWLQLYKSYGGKVEPRVPAGRHTTTLSACVRSSKKPLEVYVYVVEMAGSDRYGHVGIILQQPDGSYIRYSQAAENSNLHGVDRWQYFAWQQKVRVRTRVYGKGTSVRSIAAGGRVIRIPTEHTDQVQHAVEQYIKDNSHYHVITNNCADFVNDVLNEAEDISVSDQTVPKTYFQQLSKQYPDCVAD